MRLLPTYCLLTCFILFSACKKYPENDRSYIKSAKNRMKNYNWQFTALYINHADSTLEHLHRMLPASNEPSDFQMHIDDGFGISDLSATVHTNINAPAFEIRLENHKRKIHIDLSKYSKNGYLLWVPESRIWDIQKLTNKELIIQTNYNNNEIRFEFKH